MVPIMERTLIAGVFFICLLCIIPRVKGAATSNGELLKFYPISPEQYSSIVNLMRGQQQPVIAEGRVLDEGHASLAKWSNTLPTGWGDMFEFSRYHGGVALDYGNTRGYPLCVVKANTTQVRRKRGSRQFSYSYAGMAPNVMRNTVPLYQQYMPYAISPTEEGPSGKSDGNSVVNCVVVLRHDPKINTATIPTASISNHQQPQMFVSPQSYAYASPTLYGYPTSGYPQSPVVAATASEPVPLASSPPVTVRQVDGHSPVANADSQRIYQEVLNAYYQQLGKLYVANQLAKATRNLPGSGRGYLQFEGNNNGDETDGDVSYEDDDDDSRENESDNYEDDDGDDESQDDDDESEDIDSEDHDNDDDDDVDVKNDSKGLSGNDGNLKNNHQDDDNSNEIETETENIVDISSKEDWDSEEDQDKN